MANTRKRTRPSKSIPKVRKRERPKAKRTVPVDPRMPKSWGGSVTVVCGADNKKYKPYKRKVGAPDEENPNLMGRIHTNRLNIDPVYTAWRWLDGRYHWLCEKPTHREASEALSKAFGGW